MPHLYIAKEGQITEVFEFQEDQLISIISEFHSEDPDKDEKFENDLQEVYSSKKLEDYTLVASEYIYFPNHLNIRKVWYFLPHGEYKHTDIKDGQGYIIKGTSYAKPKQELKPGRASRTKIKNSKSKLGKRGNVRAGCGQEDNSLLRSESEGMGEVLAQDQTDERRSTSWGFETLTPNSGSLVWSGTGTNRGEESQGMVVDGGVEESQRFETPSILAQIERGYIV
jgi:hypothetical protein